MTNQIREAGSTVIGAFNDINSARMSVDELRMAGYDTDEVRLVEADSIVGEMSPDARMEAEAPIIDGVPFDTSAHGERHHKDDGIRGFFARLFGLDDDYADSSKPDERWSSMNPDSERYFVEAYNAKRCLVIVNAHEDVDEAITILRRNGAEIEDRAGGWFSSQLDQVRTMRRPPTPRAPESRPPV